MNNYNYPYRNLNEELDGDPLIRMCRMWRTAKLLFYGFGTVGVFIYVMIKCAIEKI